MTQKMGPYARPNFPIKRLVERSLALVDVRRLAIGLQGEPGVRFWEGWLHVKKPFFCLIIF